MYVARARSYAEIARPGNAMLAVMAFCVGYFLVHKVVSWPDFATALGIIFCVHSAITIQNDREDVAIDRINASRTPLHAGGMTLEEARYLEWAFTAVAIVLALYNPGVHLLPLVVWLAVGWVYNRQPFGFSRRPLLSIVTLGVAYAVIPVAYGVRLGANQWSALEGIAIALWFLRRMSVSILKDYKDEKGDRAMGKRTFYLVYGHRRTALVSIIMSALAFAGIWVMAAYIRPLNAVVVAPLLLGIVGKVLSLTALT